MTRAQAISLGYSEREINSFRAALRRDLEDATRQLGALDTMEWKYDILEDLIDDLTRQICDLM